MTLEEYKQLTKSQKPSKYRSKKTVVDCIEFDSKAEAKRYTELRTLQRAGVIQDLQLQVPYELYPTHKCEGVTIRGKKYIADFVYTQDGKTVVEDVKGYRTDEYKRKRKMFKQRYGFEITEIGGARE